MRCTTTLSSEQHSGYLQRIQLELGSISHSVEIELFRCKYKLH